MNPFTGATTTYGWRIVDATRNRGYDIVRGQAHAFWSNLLRGCIWLLLLFLFEFTARDR